MYLRLITLFLSFLAIIPVSWSQDAATSPTPPKAPQEIMLEVNMVQVILNDEHRNGIDWGAIVSDFHTSALVKQDDPTWKDKKYRVSFGTLSEDDYQVLLDALDMAGEVNQYPQSPVKIQEGTPSSINFDKQNIQLGLQLTQSSTGSLQLKLEPQENIVATEFVDGQKISASVPLSAHTTAVVTNNTTVVIGGFIQEQEIKRTRKLPLLGDIPIVGLVFRSRGHLMQKIETVIFLTVRSNAVQAPEDDST